MAAAPSAEAKKIAEALLNYLKKNNQLDILPQLIKEAKKETEQLSDQTTAYIQSAVELDQATVASIKETLEKSLGHPLEIKTSVNPELIAGLYVRVADKVVDLTVAKKINQLRERLER